MIQVLLNILATTPYDISCCLSNCSNNGQCKIDTNTQKYSCQCMNNFVGTSCQTDPTPCSSNPCLNNGTCTNLNETQFDCQCQLYYFGTFCEYRVDICANETCSGNGYCKVNGTLPVCKCKSGFHGDVCDLEDTSVKVVKGVQMGSIVIVCTCLSVTVTSILLNDGCNLLLTTLKRRRTIHRTKKRETLKRLKYYNASEIPPSPPSFRKRKFSN